MGKVGIQLKDKNNNEVYVNPFPVGAIYMSVDSRNPSQIFGGTWEQIKGQYLLGVDPETSMQHKTAGKSIGSWNTNYHTLTVSEMPSHYHGYEGYIDKNPQGGYDKVIVYGNPAGYQYYTFGTQSTGGSQGHNHGEFIPPSFTVYIWRRTA